METGSTTTLLSKFYLNRYQDRSDRFWLTIIISIAILLRVVVALFLGDRVTDLPGTFDQISYDMLSQRVMAGYGFTVAEDWWPATAAGEPTAHWSYLYTLYLTGVYLIFGYHPLMARLIQAILAGLLMPWLGYRLGCRYFNRQIGLVTAGLMAVYIYFVYYAATLMTETFYIITILWTLDVAGEIGHVSSGDTSAEDLPPKPIAQTLKLTIALGLALSATVLLRQAFLLFIPVLFAWLLWRSIYNRARTVKQMMGVVLGAMAILVLSILPWTLRNYWAFDSLVLLNTNAGFAFFWGNHPIHGHRFISILPATGPSYYDLIPSELLLLNEADLDRALLKQGFEFIAADPGRYVILSFSRVIDYFKFWPSTDSSTISNLSRLLSFGVLWPFMLYGFVANIRRSLSNEALILYLFILAYTAVHLLSWALIRYRLPVDAVLLIFASTALVSAYTWLLRYFSDLEGNPKVNQYES